MLLHAQNIALHAESGFGIKCFDANGNYLMCVRCIAKYLKVSTTTLASLWRKKRNHSAYNSGNRKIAIKLLADIQFPNEIAKNDMNSQRAWIMMQDKDYDLKIRKSSALPTHVQTYANVINSKSRQLIEYLKFLDVNSIPNGRATSSRGKTHFLSCCFSRNTPYNEKRCDYEKVKQRSLYTRVQIFFLGTPKLIISLH